MTESKQGEGEPDVKCGSPSIVRRSGVEVSTVKSKAEGGGRPGREQTVWGGLSERGQATRTSACEMCTLAGMSESRCGQEGVYVTM